VTEVNALVNRFEQAAKMMKTVARGGTPQIPGMGPIPGQKFGGAKVQPKKKGSKSGNPAKRAAENAALASGASVKPAAAGSGFGLGSKPGGPSEEELASLQKFLGR
jgi:signal recognition particle subunit SRP54